MSRFSVTHTLDSLGARQDRNLSSIGLMPIVITLLAAVGWVGWLHSESPEGVSIASTLKVPVLLALCATPLVLFVLAGPVELFRRASEKQGIKSLGAIIGYVFAVGTSAIVLVLAYPVLSVGGVAVMRRSFHMDFAVGASPLQLWSGVALTVIGLWFVMYELAQRGSSLRGAEYQTHFKGLRWVPGAVSRTKHLVWVTLVFLFYSLPFMIIRTVVNLKNARTNYEGARDTDQSVSNGGLRDLVDGKVGHEAPLENPAEHHRSETTPTAQETPPALSVARPEPAPTSSPSPTPVPAMATMLSRPASVPAGGNDLPPWAR